MRRNAAMVPYTTPWYVTSVTRRNSSGSISHSGANTDVMASFTQTSISPSSRSTRSAASSTCQATATSVGTASALPPPRSTSFAPTCSPSSPRASSATCAPAPPKAAAAARPTPADAPVTTTTLPCNDLEPISAPPESFDVLSLDLEPVARTPSIGPKHPVVGRHDAVEHHPLDPLVVGEMLQVPEVRNRSTRRGADRGRAMRRDLQPVP